MQGGAHMTGCKAVNAGGSKNRSYFRSGVHNNSRTIGNGRLQRCLMPLYTLQLSNESVQRINISNPCKQASLVGLLIPLHGQEQSLLDTLEASRYLVSSLGV